MNINLSFFNPFISKKLQTRGKCGFYLKDSVVLHASRQLENGWWTTKLGSYQDITHKRLECLEGEEYGVVEMILKRPKVNIKPLNETEQTSKDNFENFQNLARNLINVPKKEIDDNKSKKELGKKK